MRDSHTMGRCVIDKTDLSHSRLERRCQESLTRVLGISRRRESDSQLAHQEDPSVKNIDQLKAKVYEEADRKLREAKKDESAEI